ncbi:DUF350 domain-containing protein [Alteromonas sp. ASW11-36]|uniref:DUF350 domain-containing protein n=1 Tax=Alteromonas arenosi TaxID=3055817 RepID=A0ABT7STT9_9ALTE|nr:DUF350 domain-containing protein [Alteromonas sp. ASW11-36]MDM7859614.1 DUF350 domain-containing protein [Alteromonas sp. ASW11-36]
METLVKLNPLPHDLWVYLSIDIAITLLLLLVVRWVSGRVSDINVTEELGSRDNFAFGISVAGRMLSLLIVLGAVVGRHAGEGYEEAALGMVVFGLISIVLVKFGRFAHDKLVLHRVDTDAMIQDKNVSIALVDAASAIASAIILRSMLVWVEGTDLNAIVAVFSGFSVVLVVQLMITRLYEMRFASDNQNDSLQKILGKGQIALAIEHAGSLLGTALVVSSGASILSYDPHTYVSNLTGWLFTSFSLALGLFITVNVAKRIVLAGIDWRQEVDQQHNIGVAAIQFILSVGVALIVLGVLSHI